MSSFEYFRDHVSIVRVAESLGYEWNRKAGRKPLEYKHPDHNTIVISNRNGVERYFTRHESENKGTVIDFVKHRLPLFNVYYSKEAEGINKVLSSFEGIVPNVPKRARFNTRRDFDISAFKITIPKARDLVYLSSERGIDLKTIQTFIPYTRMVRSGHHPTANIGFPYQLAAGDKTVGFELVNFMFKGQARGSNRLEGVWVADLGNSGFPMNVFIGESAIDAMSFYQLYRQKYQLDQAAFISSGGYITDRQLRTIITKFPNARLHTIFDNDLSGHLYDIRTACMKAGKELRILYDKDVYKFEYNNRKDFSLNRDRVSLTNFRKESGLRSNISVHKAQGKDFNEMLRDRSEGQGVKFRR